VLVGAAAVDLYPSFAELQVATDAARRAAGYLAPGGYRTVRSLEQRNLIVALVANFARPGRCELSAWVAARGAGVTTFACSNVEQCSSGRRLGDFAENLAALPADQTSAFIRSCFNTCINATGNSRVVMLLDSCRAWCATTAQG
jgi:hypothetical protein